MSADQSTQLNTRRALRGPAIFALTLLATELLDELAYGVNGAAVPLIRTDLGLTYSQVGLLLTVPMIVGNLIDPILGLLGDVWRRKALIVGGALATALAALLVTTGHTFMAMVVAFCLMSPASTAYVSLSQATLMDLNPGRHDQVMARWTVLGSLGNLLGPLAVAGVITLGLGWRGLYLGLALLAGVFALVFAAQRFNGAGQAKPEEDILAGLRDLPRAVLKSGVVRWLILEDLADLMLDVLFSFCALYFTDVVRVTPALASAAVAVLTAGGLLGDLLVVPLLEKVDGLRLIRVTALAALGVYAAFLLVPNVWMKFALLALLGPLRSGWYPVLKGRAYSAMPDRSGAVIALHSITGLAHATFPAILGLIAERVGLGWMMAVLLLGPASIWIGARQRDGLRSGRITIRPG